MYYVHGSFRALVGAGNDCRWYIYSPAAAKINLNMRIYVSGPSSQVLIFQGEETNTYMHEDVLNAAVASLHPCPCSLHCCVLALCV
jgi:hypothetical protein